MASKTPARSTSTTGPALVPKGHHEGKPAIRLSRPVYVVGSRSSCRIHLLSSSVSKAHALLVRSNGRTYIRDLASRSKVYINGEEVREADLHDGDLIKIGTFTFQYVAGPGEDRFNRTVKNAPPAKFDVSGAELPILIDERVLVMGRRSRCDVHLLEDSVSTTHAVIFEMDGQRYVRDLGSRTGTYVNGVSTHQHLLSQHDTIRLGDNELRYIIREDAPVAVAEETSAAAIMAEPADLLEPLAVDEPQAAAEPDLAIPIEAEPLAIEEALPAEQPIEPVIAEEPSLAVDEEAPIPLDETPEPIAATTPSESEHLTIEAVAEALEAETSTDEAPIEPAPAIPAMEEAPIPLDVETAIPLDEPEAAATDVSVSELAAALGEAAPIDQADPDAEIIVPITPAETVEAVAEAPSVPEPSVLESPVDGSPVDDSATIDSPEPEPVAEVELNLAPAAPELAIGTPPPVEIEATVEAEAPVETLGLAPEIAEPQLSVPVDNASVELDLADAAPVFPVAAAPPPVEAALPLSEPEPLESVEPAHEPQLTLHTIEVSEPAPIESASLDLAEPQHTELLTPTDGVSVELPLEAHVPSDAVEPMATIEASGHAHLPLDAAELAPEHEQLSVPVSEDAHELSLDTPGDADLPDLAPVEAIEPLATLEASSSADLSLDAATDAAEEASPIAHADHELPLDPPAVDEVDTVLSVVDEAEPLPTLESSIHEESLAETPAAIEEFPQKLPLDTPAIDAAETSEIDSEQERTEFDLVPPPAQELSAEPVLPPEPPGGTEIIDRTEPTPQSALQSAEDQLALDALAAPDVPLTPVADELSDTQFDRAVREFSGSEIGDLVEAPAAPQEVQPTEEPVSEEIAPILDVPAEQIEQTQAEPMAPGAPEAPVATDLPLDLPPADETELPSLEAIAEAALNEPAEILPPPEPVAEAPVEPPPAPATTPAAQPAAPAPRPRIPWGANQDNFLGGSPLPLNAPPKPAAPVAPANEKAVRELIKEIDHVAAKAEAAAAVRPTKPPVAAEPLIPPMLPPRPRRAGPSPQRRRQNKLITTEEAPPQERNLVNTGFDGLAHSPLRDMDVFSQGPHDEDDEPLHPLGLPSNGDSQPAGGVAAGIQALPMSKPSRVTPTLQGEGEPHTGARRPQVAYAAELSEAETTAVRKKYHRRVYMLLLLMLSLIGGSWWVIQTYMGASTTVEGGLRYQNLSALTMLEQTRQQGRILQTLAEDGTRRAARTKLLNRPEIGPGFLAEQEDYVRVIEKAAFSDARPDVLMIQVVGHDPDRDAQRILAVLEAQYELNKFMVDDAHRARRDLRELTDAIERGKSNVDRLNVEIARLRMIGESHPTAQQIAQLQAEVTALEQAWSEAKKQAKSAETELEQLRSSPTGTPNTGAAGPVGADDPTLRAMLVSLDELQKKVDTSRVATTEQAAAAKRALDAALDAFQQQVASAQNTLNGNPALTAYVQDAQRLQETTRQLTDDLIRRQESQFARLTELKDRLNDRMEQRRKDVWQNDKELRDYTEKLAVAERQYNTAIASGLQREADDKKAEVELLRNLMKARQALLPGDSFYADAIGEIQEVINGTRKDIEEDRRRTEEVLSTRQQSFVTSQAIRNLPQEQRQLATDMQQKLQQVNDARRQYNSAIDVGAADGDPQIRTEIATLQSAIDARRAQVAAENTKGMQAQQEQARQAAIQPKEEELKQLKEAETQAWAAYFEKNRELGEARERVTASADNAQKLDELLRRKDAADRELKESIAQDENKRRAVALAVEPVAPTFQDITTRPGNDQRGLYQIISGGSIALIFAIMIALTLHTASIEAPASSIQATDLRPQPDDVEAPAGADSPPKAEKVDDDEEGHEPAVV